MSIKITWTDSNTTEDGYNVYRGSALDAESLPDPLVQLGASNTTYTDSTTTFPTVYEYAVGARKASTVKSFNVGKRKYIDGNLDAYMDFTSGVTFNSLTQTAPAVNTMLTDAHGAPIYVQSGNTWTLTNTNILCITSDGVQVAPTRTNGVPNNTFTGAANGSPGNMPTGWSTFSTAGVNRTSVALSTVSGIPVIDVSCSGTSNLSSGQELSLMPQNANAYPISANTSYTVSAMLAVPNGTFGDPGCRFRMKWFKADGTPCSTQFTDGSDFSLTSTLTRFTATGTSPNDAAFMNLCIRVVYTNGATYSWTLRIGLAQIERGSFATPPIATSNGAVTRTGNIVKYSLPSQFQSGVAGFVQLDNKMTFSASELPTILGFNPSSRVAEALEDIAVDAAPVANGLQTIVFAASPGYTKVRVLGGADTAAVTGDFESDIVSMSIGGNGFDANNNIYALYKKIGLMYGPQSNTTFNSLYTLVGNL